MQPRAELAIWLGMSDVVRVVAVVQRLTDADTVPLSHVLTVPQCSILSP